jgi:signal transduction histidine kinase/CheY-like chemotaxis protein
VGAFRSEQIKLRRDLSGKLYAILGIGFFIVSLTFLVRAGLTNVAIEKAQIERQHWMMALVGATELLHELYKAETGQRGYLLTGRHRYLKAWSEAKDEIPVELKELQQIAVSLNGDQQSGTDLEELVRRKLEELQETVLLASQGRHDEALARVLSDEGLLLQDKLQSILYEMRQKLEGLWRQSSEKTEQLLESQIGFLAGAMITLILSALSGFGYLLRQLHVQRRLNRDLAAAREARMRFLATITHEMRTPLHVILASLELIDEKRLAPTLQRHLQRATLSSKMLLRLVADLLDAARFGATGVTLRPQPVLLSSVIESVGDSTLPLAKKLDVSFSETWHVPQHLAGKRFLIDAERLNQVITNLLVNAIKFSAGRREAAVHLQVTAMACAARRIRLVVEVRDNGPGIDPDLMKNIFEPFVRKNSGTAPVLGSSGLGLYLSKCIVDAMGGQLLVENRPVAGLRTVVALECQESDLVERDAMEEGIKEDKSDIAPGSRAVLVVDDHMLNREVLGEQLEKLGYQHDTAENGEEALKKLLSRPFDIIITDVRMPGMSGFEFARKAREWMRKKRIQEMSILAVTANAGQEEIERAQAAGIDRLLTKPLGLNHLERALRGLETKCGEDEVPAHALRNEAGPSRVVMDTAVLARLVGPDVRVQGELLRLFVETTRQVMGELQTLSTTNFERLSEAMHQLKASALSVGAVDLAWWAKELELAVEERHVDEIPILMDGLLTAWQNLLKNLEG